MPLYGPLIGMTNWYGLTSVLEGNIASIDDVLPTAFDKYLSNFARTGNPNDCRLPRWEKWSNEADGSKAILFDATMDEAVLHMSNEEVDILTEMGKLEAEISTWPTQVQALGFVPMFFQWQVPE